ncbi:signal recognition particle subunit [Collariella sp. IMI 366227]|nr:signal recognition particle subunit [Collariella sp. IMI 366227]
MSHPRVEEVSDSDGDIDDFLDTDIMRRVDDRKPSPATTTPSRQQQHPSPSAPAPLPTGNPSFPQMHTTTDESAYKSFQCLYPVYFDCTRTRAQGRRVPLSLAVSSPLALDIVQACAQLRIPTVLEAGKLHPKDWANPGRVKVNLKGVPDAAAKNKHHLYILVAEHLRKNPTTDGSAALRMVGGAPPPPQVEEEAVAAACGAAGWKMGSCCRIIARR